MEIYPVRYSCDHCGDGTTTTEQYDWVSGSATITKGLEDYIMRNLIHSTIEDVSKKEGIGYKVIQAALDRNIASEVNWAQFKALDNLGIDEITLKNGHDNYMTLVSAKLNDGKLRVLAVIEGRNKEDVKKFLLSIPTHLRKTVKTVCTDMYDGFVNAAIEVFGVQALVIDRYHVAKLYRKPLVPRPVNTVIINRSIFIPVFVAHQLHMADMRLLRALPGINIDSPNDHCIYRTRY